MVPERVRGVVGVLGVERRGRGEVGVERRGRGEVGVEKRGRGEVGVDGRGSLLTPFVATPV